MTSHRVTPNSGSSKSWWVCHGNQRSWLPRTGSFSGNRVAINVAPRQPSTAVSSWTRTAVSTLKGPCATLGGSTVTVKPRRRWLMTVVALRAVVRACQAASTEYHHNLLQAVSRRHPTLKSAYTDDCWEDPAGNGQRRNPSTHECWHRRSVAEVVAAAVETKRANDLIIYSSLGRTYYGQRQISPSDNGVESMTVSASRHRHQLAFVWRYNFAGSAALIGGDMHSTECHSGCWCGKRSTC